MILCPLGTACRVRMAYDRYNDSYNNCGKETNLLDYSLCNFDTILYILKRINIPFNENEFIEVFYSGNPGILGSNRTASHKEVFWHLPHDFPVDQSFKQFMPNFIDMCNRRRERLINLIKTKDKCIHFIIFFQTNNGSPLEVPSLQKINELYTLIKNICNYSYVHFHFLIHPDYNNSYYNSIIDILAINIFFHIHYMKRVSSNIDGNENRLGLNWNWNEIFDQIKYFDMEMDKKINQVK